MSAVLQRPPVPAGPRRVLGMVVAFLALLSGLAIGAPLAVPTASAAIPPPDPNVLPFDCPPEGMLFQQESTQLNGGDIQNINLVGGTFTTQPYGIHINGAGYNLLDDFVYGNVNNRDSNLDGAVDAPDEQVDGMVRVGTNGLEQYLGLPDGWPAGQGMRFQRGDISSTGQYVTGNAERLWQVDMNPASPTYFEFVRDVSPTLPAGMTSSFDWAFLGQQMYAVLGDAGGVAHLYRINALAPVAANVQYFDVFPGQPLMFNGAPWVTDAGDFGAMYADNVNDFLYVSSNSNGDIYRINAQTGEVAFFSTTGTTVGLNDGARCQNAALNVDFGDAPETGYGTLAVYNGPRHSVVPGLALGAATDFDADGVPNPDASGDDVTSDAVPPSDDEDAFAGPITLDSNAPAVAVPITSTNTGDPGDPNVTVAGWIDLNGNGSFTDAGERSFVTVPAGSTSANLAWGAANGATASTFARFRLYDGTIADPQPLGPAGDGEVEDHPVTLTGTYHVEKSASVPSGSVQGVGTQITYTITVVNDSSIELPASFTDPVGDVLDDATLIAGPSAGSIDGSNVLNWSGTVPRGIGATTIVTYTVQINPTLGNGVLPNSVAGPGCPPGSTTPPCGHQVTTGTYTVAKTADVADLSTVATGSVINYRIRVTRSGSADVPATFTDDLNGVLDDATLISGPTASDGSSPSITGGVLSWSGTIPANVPFVDITYGVQVKSSVADGRLANAVVGLGCPAGTTTPPCALVNLAGSYTITKTSDAPSPLLPGQPVTYTITVTKRGEGAVTNATFSDNLAAVLDDATGPTNITADIGTATLTGQTINWTAATLGAGDVVATIMYTVIVEPVADLGDGVLTNGVTGANCTPTTSGCFVTSPVRAWTVVKTSTPASGTQLSPGATIAYHLTISNAGGTVIPDASISDSLAAVLDDATLTSGPTASAGTAQLTGNTITWANTLAVAEVVTIDYTVTLKPYAAMGDEVLTNAVVAPDAGCPTPPVTDPGAPGFDADCVTVHTAPKLVINKTSNPAAGTNVIPGQVVSYRISVTNTGTADVPASSLTDDLTQVLDDATFNGSPTASLGTATRTGNTLSWSGPVPAGQTVTIDYSVTVNAASAQGDGWLRNAVTSPNTPCTTGETDCPPVDHLTEAWTIRKDSTPATGGVVIPGNTISYTITIENTGGAPLTGKTFTDDLTDVLDDAVWNNQILASAGNATFAPATGLLTWTGNLAVAQTVTVTYTVTVRPAYQFGNGKIDNVVTPSDGECIVCSSTLDTRAWDVHKVPDKAEVTPGGTVNYTITVTNTGSLALTGLSFTDDLSGILDDADLVDGPDTTAGSVGMTGNVLGWQGNLAVDGVATITYSVRVHRPLDGDRSLLNAVVTDRPDGPCPDVDPIPARCRGDVPIRELTIVKATEPADREFAEPGETVFYTLTITNTGDLPYPNATVEDDLTAVLDDASGPVQITVTGPGASTFDPNTKILYWNGPIAVDEVAVVRYGITVSPQVTGDAHLLNVVSSGSPGALCPKPAITDPDAPGFDANCVTDTPIKAYAIHKSSDPADGSEVEPGDTITYTLTLTNTGDVDVNDETVTDDLSGVLDDATLDGDPVASDGEASITGTTLTWTGDLPVGAEVTVTYSVIVDPADETGDAIIANVVSGTGPSNCYDPQITNPQDPRFDADCATESKVKEYTIVKTADPEAGSEVESGDEITYTVTLTNTGEVALTDVEVTDSLTDVLDDADVTTEPAADAGTVERVDDVITWTGDLAIDEVVVITYTVTVKPVLELGDGLVGNVVTGTGPNQCPNPPITDADDPAYDARCSVAELVKAYTIVKSSDPADDAVVQPFDRITYTLTLTNVGAAPSMDLTVTDTLTDVLDDADLDGAPTASAGAVSVTGDVLTWTGDLAVGDVVTVTYVAVVKPPTTLGDSHLGNVVVGTGNSSCVPDEEENPDCSTNHDVAAYTTLKEVVSPVAPKPGEQVTYRVTITSVGSAPILGETISDDLSGVLDDAVWDNTATYTSGNPATVGALSFTAPDLSWTGDIAVGDVLVITYSVTLNSQITGDGHLRNVVASNDCRLSGPSALSVAFAVGEMPPGCVTDTAIPSVGFTKSVSPAGPFKPGDVVTYTITATNNGQVNLDGVTWSDDMTRVLDDADMVGQPSADRGAASFSTPMVTWTGSLGIGEVAHVTYQVTIRADRGDGNMPNGVVGVGPATNCPAVGAGVECLTLALVLPPVIPNNPTDPGELPRTGGNSTGIVLVASMLLAAGVGLIAVRRRRRSITS